MLKMTSIILWLDLIILSIGSILLIITSIKFFRGLELRDKIVGFGLVCIATALFLGGAFNFYSFYQNSYWLIVEILHTIGAILITIGIVGFNKKRKSK